MKSLIVTLLKQPSTWRGLIWFLAGLFGLTLADSDVNTLVSASMVVAGLLGLGTLDNGRKDLVREQLPPIELIGSSESADVRVRDDGVPTQSPTQKRYSGDSPRSAKNDRSGWNG